jgi:hypothetical protein
MLRLLFHRFKWYSDSLPGQNIKHTLVSRQQFLSHLPEYFFANMIDGKKFPLYLGRLNG